MIAKLKNILREKNMSSLLTNMVIAALGLASFMLLTRQLPKEVFGDWVLFITLSTFVDLLRFGLTQTSVVRLLSAANVKEYKVLMGSSYRINVKLLGVIVVVCWGAWLIIEQLGVSLMPGYELFLVWYPLLAMANLGWNSASALFQAEQNFERMMWVRLANIGLFVVFLVGNWLWWSVGVDILIWVYLAVNLLSSTWCTVARWDGLWFLRFAHKKTEKELLNFGKFSMGTLIGSSLLKSADTFIIGLSPVLGSAGIAIYAIPLKLTDLLGIPLRSFTMTAYPRMSKKFLEKDLPGVRKLFYTYTGAITIAFIPVALVCFVFAEELVLFLGGEEYLDQLALLTTIFRIFTLYTLLLPLDRFTGVLLDSINRPHLNLYKVIVMTSANIVIDIVAVFSFESLIGVAVGTVLFTIIGLFLGLYFLKREIQVKSRRIAIDSFSFIRNIGQFVS